MKKLHVMTVVGTRPEIIRLSEVIKALDRYSDVFQHTLVHTGQNYDYELNGIFFEDLGLRKPDVFLEAAAPTVFQLKQFVHLGMVAGFGKKMLMVNHGCQWLVKDWVLLFGILARIINLTNLTREQASP